jgi:hypothetical protein
MYVISNLISSSQYVDGDFHTASGYLGVELCVPFNPRPGGAVHFSTVYIIPLLMSFFWAYLY